MNLEKISQSTRYGVKEQGYKVEATVINNGKTLNVESGTINGEDDGRHVGSFNCSGSTTNFSFSNLDREQRETLTTLIEDMIEEMTEVELKTTAE